MREKQARYQPRQTKKNNAIFITDKSNKLIQSLIGSSAGREYLDRAILENAPISIMVIDANGNIAAVNRYFLRFTGSKSPVGRNIEKIYFFRREKLTAAYKELLATGKSFSRADCRTVNRQGKTIYLNIIAVPLKGVNGKIEGVISMAMDNTRAVEAKNNLQKITKQLDRKVKDRTKNLDTINRKLTDILDLKSKFVADASHELRTPLTVIRGNIDVAIMEARIKNQPIPEIYSLIIDEVERMRTVLDDMTLLTSVDTEQEKFKYENIDLVEILRSVANSLLIVSEQKKVALSKKCSKRKVIIVGDRSKMEKLISNIIINAIKYTNPGGHVSIGVRLNSHEAIITVKDTGIGIPKADLPHIFERFYRVDKARSRKEGGSGLGLSIARWVIDAHKGTIDVKSKLGEGSTFTIRIPLNCLEEPRA